MKWLYAAAALGAFGIVLVADIHEGAPTQVRQAETVAIATEAHVPNAVTGIYLRNRIFDTLFEVLVFAMAVAGVKHLLDSERPLEQVIAFQDEVGVLLCRLAGLIAGIVAVELAIRGHLNPGGGFAAGVAGGTALGLVAMSSQIEYLQERLHRWGIEAVEPLLVLATLAGGIVVLLTVPIPLGNFGSLVSGGLAPLLNILIASKVAIGASVIAVYFIRYRGLL